MIWGPSFGQNLFWLQCLKKRLRLHKKGYFYLDYNQDIIEIYISKKLFHRHKYRRILICGNIVCARVKKYFLDPADLYHGSGSLINKIEKRKRVKEKGRERNRNTNLISCSTTRFRYAKKKKKKRFFTYLDPC